MKYAAENLSKQKYGKISFVCFVVTAPNKPKKGKFLCDCGKLTVKQIANVLSGHTTNCGRCNIISKETMAVAKFGRLRQTTPKDTKPGSGKKDSFTCDCGKIIDVVIRHVLSYKTKTCGQCSVIPEETMAIIKFGRLRQTTPKDTKPGSGNKDDFTCDCGGSINTRTCDVLDNSTNSCGHCDLIVKQWYQENQAEIKKLRCPVVPGFILGGPIEALEPITKSHKPFPAICPACRNKYYPRFANVKRGNSLTCTCVSSRISTPVVQISRFICSIGFEARFEHKVNKLAYDIFVQPKNNKDKGLLIEYDGSRFHDNSDESLTREVRKEQNAINSGYEFLRVKETDWKKENIDNTKRRITSLLVMVS